MANEPELIEIEPEAGGDGEKKFKCSFCPNKIFKKKPEVGGKYFMILTYNLLFVDHAAFQEAHPSVPKKAFPV